MILQSLIIKNFRCYKNPTVIHLSNLTAFIGKNDAGKSTILDALEIFFNNSTVVCEREDLCITADNTNIEITCEFTGLPPEIIIDTIMPTTLQNEHLLNHDGNLAIKKIYSASTAKPKPKTFIICEHPGNRQCADLLSLKRNELRDKAMLLGVQPELYNGNINSSIRAAIWNSIPDLELRETELLVDKEDTKRVYDSLERYLPLYALFQSDRTSKDDDKEVVDPMKIAIQQALESLNNEIENIKCRVREFAIETANRTLEKLREMAPDLANELSPEFRSEPKFDSLFKLSIKSDNDISINKRGSGVRRLILLNFFRAEAERRRSENIDHHIIFAFEEPETSQHPNHQELLINAFLELSSTGNTQVILTTHTPAIAGLLPLHSLRFVNNEAQYPMIEQSNENVYRRIVDALGLLPDPLSSSIRALLLVEGKGDVVFVNHTAAQLKLGGFIQYTFDEKHFAIIPIGGCGNLKHWRLQKLAEQFGIPWCILLDSDLGTNEEGINRSAIMQLRTDGIKAYVTRKREPENYLHIDCLRCGNLAITYSDADDAKQIISGQKAIKKENILDTFWPQMTIEMIREVESYTDGTDMKYEFTEMFTDFLSVVP